MSSLEGDACGNCYGQGHVPTDEGSVTCPDCGGAGTLPSRHVSVDWRAREIERLHTARNDQPAQDVRWLVFELRRARSALTSLLALTEELPDGVATQQMRFTINKALRLYRVNPIAADGEAKQDVTELEPR